MRLLSGLFRKSSGDEKAPEVPLEQALAMHSDAGESAGIHEAVLKQGVETWNKWREKNPEVKPDLRRAALVHAKLAGANLQGADLRGAQMRGADLQEADLEGADLRKANLARARLMKAYLEQAQLGEADLSEADFSSARLSIADLTYAKLRRARLKAAVLVGATLRNAKLNEAELDGCKLRGSDLRGAAFNGAKLENAQLQQSDLSGVSFAAADLRQADLSGCIVCSADLSKSDLREAKLRWCNFDRAKLVEADLRGADCREANFLKSELRKADLRGADLSACYLIGAELSGARLESSRISRIVARDLVGNPDHAEMLISSAADADVLVDSLEAAQFVQLMAAGQDLRSLIISARTRLATALGDFSGQRESLRAPLRQALRDRGLAPVLFSWRQGEPLPPTLAALAGMSSCLLIESDCEGGLDDGLRLLMEGLQGVPVQLLVESSVDRASTRNPDDPPRIEFQSGDDLAESLRSLTLHA